MRIFIIEPVSYDISALYDMGEVIVLWEHSRPNIWDIDQFRRQLLERLDQHKFNHLSDSFALVGAVIPVAWATMTISEHYKLFTTVLWHSSHRTYVQQSIHPTQVEY